MPKYLDLRFLWLVLTFKKAVKPEMLIAIIDHNNFSLDSTANLMRKEGFETVGFSGNEAHLFETIVQLNPSALLIEVTLNYFLNGIDVIHNLKNSGFKGKAFILSACDVGLTFNLVGRAYLAGADGYLKKPLTGPSSKKVADLIRCNFRLPSILDSYQTVDDKLRKMILRAIEWKEEGQLFYICGEPGVGKTILRYLLTSPNCKIYENDPPPGAPYITIPPLRERIADIALLSNHYLNRYSEKRSKLTDEALQALQMHNWENNISELMEVIKSVAKYKLVTKELLPIHVTKSDIYLNLNKARVILQEENYIVKRAAKRLNIDRATIYRYYERAKVNLMLEKERYLNKR